MKKIIIIAAFIAAYAALPAHAQFTNNSARSLFSDVKAYRVGDAIMISIMEETEANNDASTTQSSTTTLGASANVSTPDSRIDVGGGISTNNNFRGRGETSRNERLRSRFSARVVEVDANGNLKIEGKRTTKINGEQQVIMLSGIVRPVDIQPDNSVFSYNISDLTLMYDGEGSITKTQEPGLITKFLRILF